MTPETPTYVRSPGHELWLAGLRWQRLVRRALKPLDLTPTQFLVLDACGSARNRQRGAVGPNQNQIAEIVGLTRQGTQRVVVALEARGLVSRGQSYDSHLSWCVDIEPPGEQLLERAGPLVEAADEAFFVDEPRWG